MIITKNENTIGDLKLLGIVEVTPEVAKELLSKNNGNRKINKNVVSSYSRDMSNGKWDNSPGGLSITIDADGNLLDGQHRLKSIIESGVTTQMFLFQKDISGIASNMICDNPLVRGLSSLTHKNRNYISTIASIIRLGGGDIGRKVTVADIEIFLSKLTDKEGDCLSYIGCNNKAGLPASLKAAFILKYINTESEDIIKSWDNLKSQVLGMNTPERNIAVFMQEKKFCVGGLRSRSIFLKTYIYLDNRKMSDKAEAIALEEVKALYQTIMSRNINQAA